MAAGQFLTAAEADVRAQADRTRNFGERDARHEAGATLGELALIQVRVLGVEHDRDGLA